MFQRQQEREKIRAEKRHQRHLHAESLQKATNEFLDDKGGVVASFTATEAPKAPKAPKASEELEASEALAAPAIALEVSEAPPTIPISLSSTSTPPPGLIGSKKIKQNTVLLGQVLQIMLKSEIALQPAAKRGRFKYVFYLIYSNSSDQTGTLLFFLVSLFLFLLVYFFFFIGWYYHTPEDILQGKFNCCVYFSAAF
tara:strand:+ start:48 stop:638 length:591 start_codon:yes stop_codon:yes gene_type:complete